MAPGGKDTAESIERGTKLADEEGDERGKLLLEADVEGGKNCSDGSVAGGRLGNLELLLEVGVHDVASACRVVGRGRMQVGTCPSSTSRG